jgi:cytochrome c biogenesis protein CcdA
MLVVLLQILLPFAGPDHLAALLPRCCGQRWFRAGRVGALWGMGHGVSATLLGVAAFFLKNTLSASAGGRQVKRWLSGMSHATEIAVGLSLILIGVMGIREAREWQEEMETAQQPQSLSAAASPSVGMKDSQKRAVVLNGLLHGFSWDGAPSLAPAVAVATWGGNLAFLSAYAAGTTAAMAIATTLIGEGTRKAGQVMDRPDLPQKLSLISSFVAIAIGGIWCGLAVL